MLFVYLGSGFGFVIYKNPEDAEKALGIHKDLGPNVNSKLWVLHRSHRLAALYIRVFFLLLFDF